MQKAQRAGRPYYQVYLDLSKAYNTLDQDKLYAVMEVYGVGPRTLKLLKLAWMDSV